LHGRRAAHPNNYNTQSSLLMQGFALIVLIVAVGLFTMSHGGPAGSGHPLLVWVLTLLAGFFYWLAEPNDD